MTVSTANDLIAPVALELAAIIVDFYSIPESGLNVQYRRGECFGDEITWSSPEIGILVQDKSCNPQGESGINILDQGRNATGWGFAGWEESIKTWWRYFDEPQKGVYREHCMQVLSILKPS